MRPEPIEMRFKLLGRMMVAEGFALLFLQDAVVDQNERIARMQRYRQSIDASTCETGENCVLDLPYYEVHIKP